MRSGSTDRDPALDELMAVEDAEELCRRLLGSPSGWGSSTRHMEAVELLVATPGTGDVSTSFLALLLCGCGRWRRAKGRLIVAIEESGLLDDADLDELAASFLSAECRIAYRLAWVSPQWLDVDLTSGAVRTVTVDEQTMANHRLSIEPPLRRWAAHRALGAEPSRLDELLRCADVLRPRDRDALIHGLLDAAGVLDETQRRDLVRRGLQAGQTSVRRTALDRLCDLDGPASALRRARADSNAATRRWRPRTAENTATLSLFAT